jgi:hypothetical protein
MTDSVVIGKLERVPLREVWKHEAYDFTQWLQDNVDVLNTTLKLLLVNLEREQAAGSFSIDLVAEEEGGGKVIIENQLEKSNHDHLGKLITYLTILNAQKAVWIVSEPRPEHVAAISWLNDSSSASFYLVKVEAVRIGSSPPAPLLNLIVGPSEQKSEVAKTNIEFAERDNTYRRWWTKLIEHPEAKLHSHITAPGYAWIGTTTGIRGLSFNYSVRQDYATSELYIDRGKDSENANKAIFDQLIAHRAEIEQAFGTNLNWERLDTRRASRITARVEGGYKSPEEEWPEIQTELIRTMNRLEKAIRPYLKIIQLRTEAAPS